jgi:hypothetical protein
VLRITNSSEGSVKLTYLQRPPDTEVGELHLRPCLRGHGHAGDVPPGVKSLSHFLSVHTGREAVASRAEVRRDRTIGGEEALGVSDRLEPLHPSFPLPGRLMGIFHAIIEVTVLAVFHPGQDLSHGSPRSSPVCR